MTRHPFAAALAATVTVGLLTAGCSQTVAGTAVPNPSESLAGLNTGGFSTAPRTVQTSPAQQRVLAGNLLADRAVFPWSIDKDLTEASGATRSFVQAGNLSLTLSDDTIALLKKRNLIYGFTTGRTNDASPTTKTLLVGLWRMVDDAAAAGAVSDYRALHKDDATTIAGHSDTAASKTDDDSKYQPGTRIESMTAMGPLVVYVWAQAPDLETATSYTSKALDEQATLLKGFSSPSEAEVAKLPADKDSIVSYTEKPEPIAEGQFESDYGFLTTRAELQFDDEPVDSAKIFEETGMDLMGRGGVNNVYRTRDADGAERLKTSWLALLAKRDGAKKVTVDGLPQAGCYTWTVQPYDKPYTSCYVTAGRYMSEASGVNAERVKQITAAAYVTLRQAK